jgi:phospho-N-acetylmuramoyl-pentapeptide-transferase
MSLPPPVLLEIMPHDPNENMAVSLALAALSFIITIIIGRPMVTFLRQKKYGKKVRDELTQHMGKTGTPTMGGLMIVASIVLVTLVFNVSGRLSILLPVFVLISCCLLGFFDDRRSLVGGKQQGMPGRQKMIWLLLISVAAALVLHLPDPYGLGLHSIYVPFYGQLDMSFWYVPIAVLGIAGMANAVNYTDGVDSLAAMTTAIAFCAYGIIAYRQGQLGVVAFCFITVGALAGFLWFNAHPAQIFMGDTGSLPLGAALATAAFMTGQWLLLPIVGIVFVAELFSSASQQGWYKYTRKRYGQGRRIFLMAPLHHHFEVKGWQETQIMLRFALIGMMAGLLGVALALL